MTDEPKSKETQSELFEQFSSTAAPRADRFPNVSRTQKPILFSTNTEQLLMAGILFILALCGVFFLGVLRGKALSSGREESPAAVSQPRPKAVPVPAVVATPVQPSKAPPASAGPVSAPEVSSKIYTIQIVTHRKKELAEAEMNGLRAKGFYSFIIPSKEYFQVCVGQFASKEEAKGDLDRFKAKFKDSYIRRR